MYTWLHFHNIRPYAKFFAGYGNTDYGTLTTPERRYHDSRTITSVGGGAEFRAYRNLWVRADYEYQFWHDFYFQSTPAGELNPQGFTFGASYHLSSPRFRLFRR
jgi:opacity protein-like surface antigen